MDFKNFDPREWFFNFIPKRIIAILGIPLIGVGVIVLAYSACMFISNLDRLSTYPQHTILLMAFIVGGVVLITTGISMLLHRYADDENPWLKWSLLILGYIGYMLSLNTLMNYTTMAEAKLSDIRVEHIGVCIGAILILWSLPKQRRQ